MPVLIVEYDRRLAACLRRSGIESRMAVDLAHDALNLGLRMPISLQGSQQHGS